MKRTYEQSLKFFQHSTENRGNGRELYKTPKEIIRSIVSDLLKYDKTLYDKIWIDPCSGDGVWGEVFDEFGLRNESYDIVPLTEKVKVMNFYNMTKRNEDIFIIGNPPFSEVKKFVNKASELCDRFYFLGGSMLLTGSLSDKVERLHRFTGVEGNQKDRRSKISFIDTNGNEVYVWCCGALFNNYNSCKLKRDVNGFRVGASKYAFCEDNDRIIPLKGVK